MSGRPSTCGVIEFSRRSTYNLRLEHGRPEGRLKHTLNPDLDSLVEAYNAGVPIPEVGPKDLHEALRFSSEARAVLARHAPVQAEQGGASFFLEGLAERCSPDADVFSVFLRGCVLHEILKLDRINIEQRGPDRDELIIRVMAKMPLVALEFKDPEAILRRVLEFAKEHDLE